MGGSPKPKRPTNAQRNAEILAAQKSGQDAAALRNQASRIRASRKRSPLVGGSEGYIASLGGGVSPLGVNG